MKTMTWNGILKSAVAALLALCVATAWAHEGGEGGGGSPDIITLEPLVVNLKDGHYVQIKALIKLVAADKAEYVRSRVPMVRHALIKYMMGRDPSEVSSPKFMTDFSSQATDIINQAIDSTYVKTVMFDTWLVQ